MKGKFSLATLRDVNTYDMLIIHAAKVVPIRDAEVSSFITLLARFSANSSISWNDFKKFSTSLPFVSFSLFKPTALFEHSFNNIITIFTLNFIIKVIFFIIYLKLFSSILVDPLGDVVVLFMRQHYPHSTNQHHIRHRK